jgi:UDP-glucose 4-epimerase
MKILVTGGSGFIGSHVMRSNSEHHLESLDKSGEPDYKIDITDVDWSNFPLADFHSVIHLAAEISVEESFKKPDHYWDTNVEGTRSLFQACISASVPRLIFASSAAVYGPSEDPLKVIGEESTPQSPYAKTKLEGEQIGKSMSCGETTVTSFRFFNVYGPGQPQDSPYAAVIPIFVNRLCNGDPIEIHGDGGQTRDFVHVSDVSRILLRSATSASEEENETLNLGTGVGISIIELAETISTIVRQEGGPSEPKISFAQEREGDIRFSIADTSGLEKYSDKTEFIDFDEGIRDLVRESLR